MTLYKQHYRIESARLRGWNYATTGYYFVTICTQHRQHFFGSAVEECTRLSPIGKIVADEWLRTEYVRQNVSLDEWIIMPNHIHGIIIIHAPDADSNAVETPCRGVCDDGNGTNDVETPRRGVCDEHNESMQTPRRGVSTTRASALRAGSLGAIIGQFKSAATKRIRAARHRDFAWQTRFYDVIIPNERALQNMREYIQNNPCRWHVDQDNVGGLFM